MHRSDRLQLCAVCLLCGLFIVASGCPSASKPETSPQPPVTTEPTTTEQSAPPTSPPPETTQVSPAPESPPAPIDQPATSSADPFPVDQEVTDSAAPSEEPPEQRNPLRDDEATAPMVSEPSPPVAMEESPSSQKEKELPTSPPLGRPQTSKNSSVPFDPIKENGPIFEGWPTPKVAMVITGMERGYLEPCGCAGLDRMKGGMSRRATLLKELRQKGWPIVALDVGGLVHGFGRQAELKYQTAVEGKRKMRYDAIAFGADDLRLPAGELVAVAAEVEGQPSPFLAANVGLLGKPGEITPQFRVFKAGGIKFGVTAILGKEEQKEIHNDEIEMLDPESALSKIVPQLKRQADYLVLLSHASVEESIALGKRFPEFQVVISSGGYAEPPATPDTIPGSKSLLITVGYKGMNAIVLGLFDDAQEPFRYQRVPLDSRFAASPDMKMLMTTYQDQLKAIGFAGLGLRPVPHPQAETNGRFIGTKKCATCHEISYDIWRKTGHAKAYETLEKLDPPRNFDPECVSCHVVGWHPTKYFPYQTGYESKEKTPELLDVGCENCHGPGEKHAQAESGGDTALQEKLRKAMIITKEESKKQQCYSCHDLDNSPDFDFDKYWPFVEHREKE